MLIGIIRVSREREKEKRRKAKEKYGIVSQLIALYYTFVFLHFTLLQLRY